VARGPSAGRRGRRPSQEKELGLYTTSPAVRRRPIRGRTLRRLTGHIVGFGIPHRCWQLLQCSHAVMNWGDMLTTTMENEPHRGHGGGRSAVGSAGTGAGARFSVRPRFGLRGRRLTIRARAYHAVNAAYPSHLERCATAGRISVQGCCSFRLAGNGLSIAAAWGWRQKRSQLRQE
jgi:hypothetical protein